MPLLWGRARPRCEGGMGGSDRAAQLDNVGLGIFAYQVARDSGALHLLAAT